MSDDNVAPIVKRPERLPKPPWLRVKAPNSPEYATTRTLKARVELANPGGLLKPGMYAQVELSAGNAAKVVAVPVSAVIDSGVRKVVLVQPARRPSRSTPPARRGRALAPPTRP